MISTKSDLVDQHLPMMRVGLQAMAVMNGAAGLASCFCPGIPNRLVPKGLMEKATKFVEGLDKDSNVADYDVVQGEVERQGGGSSGAKRGPELREYVKFLREHDPDGTYAKLMRVCDKDTGRAIWVTKESAEKIEDTTIGARRRSVVVGMGEGVGYEAKAAAEIKRLEEENKKLLEALKRATGAGGNGSKGVSSSTKLRQTVLAERDI